MNSGKNHTVCNAFFMILVIHYRECDSDVSEGIGSAKEIEAKLVWIPGFVDMHKSQCPAGTVGQSV